jgi:hypothetical protein
VGWHGAHAAHVSLAGGAHVGVQSPLGGRGPMRSAMMWRRWRHSDPAMLIDSLTLPP